MATAALVLSLCAALVAGVLALAARRDGRSTRTALAEAVRAIAQTTGAAERARAHAEGARLQAIATRSEVRAMLELLHEVRDEACRAATVRPARPPGQRSGTRPDAETGGAGTEQTERRG
jgi:hypothetical protein